MKKFLLAYIFSLIVVLGYSTQYERNNAATYFYDSYAGYPARVGQTFTIGNTSANESFVLDSILLFESLNNCYIEIYATSGGLPTGSAISTTVSKSFYDRHYIMSPVALQPSTMYAMVIYTSGVVGSVIEVSESNVYTGGEYIKYNGSVWSYSDFEDEDIRFATYGKHAPIITSQPTSITRCPGTSATFSVVVDSDAPTYQWRKGGSNISGATSASYTIASVTTGSAGNYDCVVTESLLGTTTTSSVATLTVPTTTSITGQPTSISRCVGASATFSVTAAGSSLTYQWKKNGSNISGATSSSYTMSSVATGDAANYTVTVTGTCGTITSSAAVLTVNTPPSISAHPESANIPLGDNVTFSVTATGTSLTYQWQKNGSNITGATSSSYSITGVVVGDAGNYTVVITGTCANTTSNTAVLTIGCDDSLLTGLTFYAPFDDAIGTTYIETYPTTSNWVSGPVGTVTLESEGKLGTSFFFNGNDYVITQEQAGIQMGTSDFSMFMWINPTSYYNQQDSSSMYIIGGETGSAVLLMQIGTGYLQLKSRNVANAPISDLIPIKNQWNLVGVRFLSGLTTNNLIYYCNGEEDTVTYNADFTAGAASYVIGQSDVGVRTTDFMGSIDEVSIWKRSLTAAEVALLYNSGDGLAYPLCVTPYIPPVSGLRKKILLAGKPRNYLLAEKQRDFGVTASEGNPPAGSFTVYNSWDFENEDFGVYTDAEISEDFVVNTLYSHNSANIVTDEINGVETKVMRITHLANQVSVGFQLFADLEADYNEIYLSYNWKFSEEFDATAGGKLPGMGALPNYTSGSCPVEGQGFGGVNLFKYDGWVTTYHYDNTKGYCPWSGDGFPSDYVTDTIYLVNGNWYNITQRYVVNTFTAGNPNADGIRELWIDGKLIQRLDNLVLMLDDSPTMKIDELRLSHFYGGTSGYAPLNQCYGYIDNIKIYLPDNDPTLGTYNTHSTATIIETPDEITDKNVYYDQLITVAGTLQNSQYGSSYSPCIDEVYLIDAGAGKTVSYNLGWTIGGGDALTFLDGNQTDSEIIRRVEGYDASSNQTITSTGRYLFVRFSSDKYGGTTGFTGTLTFN